MTTAPYLADLKTADNGSQAYWLTTTDGVRIRVSLLRCQGARGTFVIFPGRTEYIEKYAFVAKTLAGYGFDVVTIDWRGQGLSDRLLDDPRVGHVGTFDDYQRDVDAVMAWMDDIGLTQPRYLLAHSMGGCIGLRRLVTHQEFESVIFSGPMWGIHFPIWFDPFVNPLTWVADKLGLSNGYAPSTDGKAYVLEEEFSKNKLTTDETIWSIFGQHMTAAPDLIVGGPSFKWVAQARREMDDLTKKMSPGIPCYCILGCDESIVSTTRIVDRMKRWPQGHLHMVPEGQHETLMEDPASVAKRLDHALGFLGISPPKHDPSERTTLQSAQ